MADDYSPQFCSPRRKQQTQRAEMFLGYREKKEQFYYEHNDIELLIGAETSAETTKLILETV